MDDNQRKLVLLLYEDPRMPMNEIARRLGISRQAADRRMRDMERAGLFESLRAEISNFYLDGVLVWIWGHCRASSLQKALDGLGESEFTTRATVAGGRELFVWGYLRKISDLSGYVEFVRTAAEMPELTIGLPCFCDGINPISFDGGRLPKEAYRRLSQLDLRIIAALQGNARRPVSEIADMVGVTAKTVRRHIEIMRREGSLDFNAPWDIPPGEDMITIVFVNLKKGVETVNSAKRLLSIDPIHFMYLRQFSNLPGFLVGLISSCNMAEIRRILRMIEDDEAVLTVVPNLIYFERGYTPWDYRWLQTLERGNTRSSRGEIPIAEKGRRNAQLAHK